LTDDENLAPDEPEPGSFLESLGNVDWNELNDEMDEYLNDGTESDNESTGSRSSDKDDGRKRRREEQTDDEDSDHGSALSKKQKTSSGRASALKTPSKLSESSLPTPGVTGDEAGEREGGGDGEETDGGSDYNDLEADLLAELDREDDENDDGENEGGDAG
jgi:RNA polymerase II subunit A-like phosphatase